MENKLEVGSKVYVNRNPGNDTGCYMELEGQFYYITRVDGSVLPYCVWSNMDTSLVNSNYIGWFSEEELTLVEVKEESKVIVINPTKESKDMDAIATDSVLYTIYSKDREFYEELDKLIKYLASTYSDKYENDSKSMFQPKEGLTKETALWNVSKYLRRYDTVGFEKSENPKDMLKAIHYLLMENKRKSNGDKN